MRSAKSAYGLAAALALAACTTPPQEAPPPAPAVSPPVTAPEPPPPPVEPVPPGPVSAVQAQQAQRQAQAAVEMLEQGHEEQALVEIQRALQTDPANRLAQSLLRQVQSDPQQMLGRESFSYRVQAGESLSRIAGRFLGDVHLFYALARYNDIKVPRQVQEGQLIRVPGKAPLPAAVAPPAPVTPPPPTSAPAASPAAPPASAIVPAAVSAASASARAQAASAEAFIAQHYRRGLALLAEQKPAEAIDAFDAVLERDPQHANAKLRRAQAVNQVGGLIRLLENTIRRLDGRIAKDPGNAALKAERAKAASERERLLTVK
jgi:Tfp pilus assembly protein PilF